MENIKAKIRTAITTLADPTIVCRELPESKSGQVFREALAHFVASGDRRWWREDFSQPSTAIKLEDAFCILPSLVPDKTELVWFIAEDDQLPFFPIFESNVESISQIVGECYGFEYHIVQKQFEWLPCENHHDTLFGIGKVVEVRIKELPAQQVIQADRERPRLF
jgi:hypothetical protein